MPQSTSTPHPQPSPAQPVTVTHATGLTFTVIDGTSNFARVARTVRRLTMLDGTTWTVGQPIGWHGHEAAWQPTETPQERADRIALYGRSIQRRDRIQLGLRITAGTR